MWDQSNLLIKNELAITFLNLLKFNYLEFISFVIYYSAICDTCMAMGEWVENPHAESALSNILPCVDQRTTNKTLFQSKQVVTNIVSIVNRFIYDTADASPAQGSMNYYNQSGPAMPPLCYPFDSQFRERQCTPQEVSSANASLVYFFYVHFWNLRGKWLVCRSITFF